MRVIRGRVFFRGQLEPLSLGIDDGKIAAIKKVLRGDDEVDFGDSLILPGCVDLHVHMRDPGYTAKEDFSSGTRSAAIGGVTTVGEMPNTSPPVTTRTALEEKAARLQGRAAVDYVLYAAPQSAEAVRSLAQAAAFKIYMAESTGRLAIDPRDLGGILAAAEPAKKLVAVHAEDPTKFAPAKGSDLAAHDRARPKAAETSAVSTLSRVRGEAKVHVAHVTCVEALEEIPANATTEVTPHHLFLDRSMTLGSHGKVNPPLRGPDDRDKLWDAFRNGRIDAVASDHAPHTLEEKSGPFEEAPAGMPGVATAFPLLMRATRAGNIDLPRLVSVMATRPAEILDIAKGAIEVGRDADLIAVDPRRVVRITAKACGYKCGWTPFAGHEGVFPLATFVRGHLVTRDGELVEDRVGEMISRVRRRP